MPAAHRPFLSNTSGLRIHLKRVELKSPTPRRGAGTVETHGGRCGSTGTVANNALVRDVVRRNWQATEVGAPRYVDQRAGHKPPPRTPQPANRRRRPPPPAVNAPPTASNRTRTECAPASSPSRATSSHPPVRWHLRPYSYCVRGCTRVRAHGATGKDDSGGRQTVTHAGHKLNGDRRAARRATHPAAWQDGPLRNAAPTPADLRRRKAGSAAGSVQGRMATNDGNNKGDKRRLHRRLKAGQRR